MSKSTICQFCDKEFGSRSGKSTHIKYSCLQNPNRIDAPKRDRTNLSKDVSGLAHVVHDCVKVLAVISEKISATNNNNNTSTCNNSHNTVNISTTNNITNNVLINNYGNETLEHISGEFVSQCINKYSTGIIELLEKIYFDPNVPQNRTIKIKSRKKDIMQAHENGIWIKKDKNTLLDDMINKGYKILHKHHIQNSNTSEESVFAYDEFISKLMTKHNLPYFKLRKNVYLMIDNKNWYILGK